MRQTFRQSMVCVGAGFGFAAYVLAGRRPDLRELRRPPSQGEIMGTRSSI